MPSRTNGVTNPSLETNATGWTAQGAGTTVARSTAQFFVGAASLLVTVPAVANGGVVCNNVTAAVGATWTASCYLRGNAGGETVDVELRNQAGTIIASSPATLTTGWQRFSATGVTPGGTTSVHLRVNKTAATAHTYYLDAALVELSATLGAYFDGATADAAVHDYAWTGTAHASTSTDTFPGVEAQLVGAQTPQNVLVTVADLLAGDEVTVYRLYAGADRELVRGGIGVVPGTALLLGDVQAPFDRLVSYEAEVVRSGEQATFASNTVTIPAPGDHVLSDPFTGTAVIGNIKAESEGRSQAFQGAVLRPSGRERPIVLFDERGGDEGTIVFETLTRENTAALKRMLAAGPVVSRIGDSSVDWPGSEVLAVMNLSRAHRQPLPVSDAQTWVLPFLTQDDPDPDRAVQLTTLQDIADAYPGGTLNDIAADFAGGTLLDIAQHDWTLGPP